MDESPGGSVLPVLGRRHRSEAGEETGHAIENASDTLTVFP